MSNERVCVSDCHCADCEPEDPYGQVVFYRNRPFFLVSSVEHGDLVLSEVFRAANGDLLHFRSALHSE